jgi:hypothetical protein
MCEPEFPKPVPEQFPRDLVFERLSDNGLRGLMPHPYKPKKKPHIIFFLKKRQTKRSDRSSRKSSEKSAFYLEKQKKIRPHKSS